MPKPISEVPGEQKPDSLPIVADETPPGVPPAPPPGFPGAGEQPVTAANQMKAHATEEAVPGALTMEQMQAEFFKMKKQLDAQAEIINQRAANDREAQADAPKAVSEDEAQRKIDAQIKSGSVPSPVLTDGGYLVHPLTHSSAEAVDSFNERNAKKKG